MGSGRAALARGDASRVLVGGEPFDVFFRRTYRVMVSYAWTLGGSWSAAEDVTMDAYEAAMKRWDEVRVFDSPEAWVRRVIANRSVSRHRRYLSERNAILRLTDGRQPSPLDLGDSVATVEAIRGLPHRQAQAVALHYLLGLSRSETAREMEVSDETVKTHLERARAALAVALGDSI